MNIYDNKLKYLDGLLDRLYKKELLTAVEQQNVKLLEAEYQEIVQKRDKLERN